MWPVKETDGFKEDRKRFSHVPWLDNAINGLTWVLQRQPDAFKVVHPDYLYRYAPLGRWQAEKLVAVYQRTKDEVRLCYIVDDSADADLEPADRQTESLPI